MYIVSLHYLTELSEVDKFLVAHRKYLDTHYQKGHFIASGGKVPRTGGIILAVTSSRSELETILNSDPFIIHQVASYEVTEFVTSKMVPELVPLLQ